MKNFLRSAPHEQSCFFLHFEQPSYTASSTYCFGCRLIRARTVSPSFTVCMVPIFPFGCCWGEDRFAAWKDSSCEFDWKATCWSPFSKYFSMSSGVLYTCVEEEHLIDRPYFS